MASHDSSVLSSGAAAAPSDCDCPNADLGEHYNECNPDHPWHRRGNRQAFGAVAGIVKTPGIDDALDAIESEADIVKENVNLLEGAAQSRAELERWNVLYRETLTQCNKRLIPHGVVLGGCAPNPSGLGAVFAGIDHDKRDYLVTLSLPAKERNDFANASKEDFVRWAIDTICGAVLDQREIYLRRAGLGSKGSNQLHRPTSPRCGSSGSGTGGAKDHVRISIRPENEKTMGEKTAEEKLADLTEQHAALAARRGWFVEDVAGVDPPTEAPTA